MKFRKMPVEIDALMWDGRAESATPVIDWILSQGGTACYHEERWYDTSEDADGNRHSFKREAPVAAHIAIDTFEGTMKASAGDYVIRGVKGEFYPCKPDIFEATYEVVDADATS